MSQNTRIKLQFEIQISGQKLTSESPELLWFYIQTLASIRAAGTFDLKQENQGMYLYIAKWTRGKGGGLLKINNK